MSPVCSLQQAGGEVSNCGDCKKQCREDVVAHVVPLFGIPYVLLLLSFNPTCDHYQTKES